MWCNLKCVSPVLGSYSFRMFSSLLLVVLLLFFPTTSAFRLSGSGRIAQGTARRQQQSGTVQSASGLKYRGIQTCRWMSLEKGPGTKGERPSKKKPKDDVVEVEGRVVESLPNAMFRVEIEPSKQVVLTTISGKIRKNFVRIVVGDSVTCELSAYDLTKGRITFRKKQGGPSP